VSRGTRILEPLLPPPGRRLFALAAGIRASDTAPLQVEVKKGKNAVDLGLVSKWADRRPPPAGVLE
jgi:hypothetical protein